MGLSLGLSLGLSRDMSFNKKEMSYKVCIELRKHTSRMEHHTWRLIMECIVSYLSEHDAMLIFMCNKNMRAMYCEKEIKDGELNERESILRRRELWITTGMFKSPRQHAQEMWKELMKSENLNDNHCIYQIRKFFEICKKTAQSVLINYPSYSSFIYFLRGNVFEERIRIREKLLLANTEQKCSFIGYDVLFRIQFFHQVRRHTKKMRFNYIVSYKVDVTNDVDLSLV